MEVKNTLQKQRELMPHLIERSELLKQQIPERDVQLKSLIRQSFDIFSNYGAEPEALANMFFGFRKALERCLIEEVGDAFNEWLTTRKTMPRPCNILFRCLPSYPVPPEQGFSPSELNEFIRKNAEVRETRLYMTGGIDPEDIERD